MIADELNINECMVYQIVTQNLNMRLACVKMVTKYLDDQKALRIEMPAEMFEWLETEAIPLNPVIKCDKIWFLDVTLKQRDSVRNSAHHSLQDGRKLA
jgi:hypothetical protein